MKKIILLFLLISHSILPFINIQKPKYNSAKEALSEKLIKRLSPLDFNSLLLSNIPEQIIEQAQSVHPVDETSTPDDFLKIWPINGKTAFTIFLDEQNLGEHIKKFRNKFLAPFWNILQLSHLMKTEPKVGKKSSRYKTQLNELRAIWNQILKVVSEEELTKKIEFAKKANDLLCKLYAARVTSFLSTLPPLTKTQRLIRKLDIVDFLNNYNMDLVFSHPILIRMNVVDPESAEKILLPIYKDIKDLWFLRSMKAHFWPAQIPLRDDYRLRLNAAFKALDVHSHIKQIIKQMRGLTIRSAQEALEQIVSSVTIIPETINDVTQKVGPFKVQSDELTSAAEPILKKLNELKGSVHAFVEKMEGQAEPVSSSASTVDASILKGPAPLPVTTGNAQFTMGQPVTTSPQDESITAPVPAPVLAPAVSPEPQTTSTPPESPLPAKILPSTPQPMKLVVK
ncbi:hypothetical protein FJ366_00050 [Candidatus Dependentiae bacterium]|nr:hypothetical protein [Candidatus Dependentiae bacterium]